MLLTGLTYGQTAKYSNEFLAIGVGARALGMSNSVIASSKDATGTYWNPSLLNYKQSDLEIGLMHAEYFAGIANYDFGSIVAKIDETSSIGFSMIRFGIDDIPDTSELIDANGNINYDKIKTFSANDNAFLISYAKDNKKITGLSLGGNVKIIHRKVGSYAKAWGFGLDFGASYEKKGWNFAMVGRDITSTFNAWSFSVEDLQEVFTLTGNEIPQNSVEITLPKLLFGVGRNIAFSEDVNLYAEVDWDVTFDGQRNVLVSGKTLALEPHLGLELSYDNMIYLRGGLGNMQRVTDFTNTQQMTFQPNVGLGLQLKKIALDYALTDIGDQSIALYSHIFSLRIGIDKK